MRKEELSKCTPTVGSARTKFFPFFPMPQGISSPLSYVSIFFLTFSPFSQAKRFLFYFLLCHKFIRTTAEHLFRSRGKFVIFDFVLVDGSRQWYTPKLLKTKHTSKLLLQKKTKLIHLTISSNTSGEMVSSISPYSVGSPVLQCWKRWLSDGYSLMLFFFFRGRSRRMAGRFCVAMT